MDVWWTRNALSYRSPLFEPIKPDRYLSILSTHPSLIPFSWATMTRENWAESFVKVKLWFGCGNSTMSTAINGCNFLPVKRELHPPLFFFFFFQDSLSQMLHMVSPCWSCPTGYQWCSWWGGKPYLRMFSHLTVFFFLFFASRAQFAHFLNTGYTRLTWFLQWAPDCAAAGWSMLSWSPKTWVASIPAQTVIKLNWKCDLWCL